MFVHFLTGNVQASLALQCDISVTFSDSQFAEVFFKRIHTYRPMSFPLAINCAVYLLLTIVWKVECVIF